MKIARIDVFGYDLNYVHGDYVMSRRPCHRDRCRALSCESRRESGVEGFGEVCPLGPAYLPAHGEGARAALARARPGADRRRRQQPGRGQGRDGRALDGSWTTRRARVDIACWDALGRAVGLPVCDAARRRVSSGFPLYVAVPLASAVGDGRIRCARASARGSAASSSSSAPTRTRTRRASRRSLEATGPEDVVIADANGGWRLQDAIVAARALDGLDRVCFEQPCPTLEECLIVRAAYDAADGPRRGHHATSTRCSAPRGATRSRRSTSRSAGSADSPRRS